MRSAYCVFKFYLHQQRDRNERTNGRYGVERDEWTKKKKFVKTFARSLSISLKDETSKRKYFAITRMVFRAAAHCTDYSHIKYEYECFRVHTLHELGIIQSHYCCCCSFIGIFAFISRYTHNIPKTYTYIHLLNAGESHSNRISMRSGL